MPIRVSFEIPPEEFSSSSALCCQFKRKAKAGELTNATAIITHLITQANKENINLHPILLDIHHALELCGTIQEANGALYEALVEVTLSLVTSNDDKLPSFDYLQVLPRYQHYPSFLIYYFSLLTYFTEFKSLSKLMYMRAPWYSLMGWPHTSPKDNYWKQYMPIPCWSHLDSSLVMVCTYSRGERRREGKGEREGDIGREILINLIQLLWILQLRNWIQHIRSVGY